MHCSTSLRRGWISIFLLLLSGGCSQFGSGTEPDAMSAEAHEHASSQHIEKALEHEQRYRPDVEVPRSSDRSDDPEFSDYYSASDTNYFNDYHWGADTYNSTERHLRHGERHRLHADAHEGAARELKTYEELQCGAFPVETRQLCPLLGQVESVEDVPGGVRIRFSEGVDVNAAVAHMRCHLAFARSKGRSGMDSCPLYLAGIEISRAAARPEVDLLADDASTLELLRQRVRAHVDSRGER
jgi:hypothetical protein